MATPLHWAARSGHLQMVTLLVKHHADPSIIDNQGYNALHLSVHVNFFFSFFFLLLLLLYNIFVNVYYLIYIYNKLLIMFI